MLGCHITQRRRTDKGVIPTKTGIHNCEVNGTYLDARLRGHDENDDRMAQISN